MEYSEFKYSLKVWLTCVVVAPVIMMICDYSENSIRPPSPYHGNFELLSAYPAIVFFGSICSLPTYLFFFLFVKITVNCTTSIVRMKSIISVLGIGLVAGTFGLFFFLMGGGTPNVFIYSMIASCLCIGWFSWFYKLAVDEKVNY